MLIDTHCHLADEAFAGDRAAVVERMREAGVARALVIESTIAQLEQTLDWAIGQSGIVLATGCHPHDASRWSPALAELLGTAWRHPIVRAAGEMGLDYHYDFAPRDRQREVFAEQLDRAVQAGLPVVIHAREADADVVAILREQPTATVILHSFSSGPTLAEAGLTAGWYFSFSGMVSFKSWTDSETLRAVPDDRILVETDAPYLAPVPYRGKRNEPAYIPAIAAKVAEWRGATVEHVATITSANALRLFWPGESPA